MNECVCEREMLWWKNVLFCLDVTFHFINAVNSLIFVWICDEEFFFCNRITDVLCRICFTESVIFFSMQWSWCWIFVYEYVWRINGSIFIVDLKYQLMNQMSYEQRRVRRRRRIQNNTYLLVEIIFQYISPIWLRWFYCDNDIDS